MKILLPILLLAGCLTAAHIPRGYLGPDDRGKHRVVESRRYMTYAGWSNSPWFRITDAYATPVFLLIDNLGYACVVPAAIWTLQPRYTACPTGWRGARP